MAAPKGNQNAARKKPWAEMLRKAIAHRDAGKPENEQFLYKLANQVLDDCLNEEPSVSRPARDELWNRLDGKFVQAIAGDDENPLTMITRIERVIVKN